MKKLLLLLIFSILLFSGVGYSQSNSQIPVFNVPSPDLSAIKKEDEDRAKQGIMYRIGIVIPVELNIYKDGQWLNDGNGNLIYNIEISSAGAEGLSILFDEFTLPEKAELRVYNPTTKYIVGPYTSEQNTEDGSMITGTVLGDRCIMEVVIPANAVGELKLHVNEVGYFYRNADPMAVLSAKNLGDSDACEVNGACSEGASWTNPKRGVAMVQVKEGAVFGLCSGSLINNTGNDCTPYFMLAQHCGAGASPADFRAWIFYFKYESTTCANPGSEPTTSNVTGSLKVAASGTTSIVSKSDFVLCILKSRPVSAANAYYNGWNKNNTASPSGVGVHHPSGDIKKISTYSATLTSTTWDGTPNSHWRVVWVATANGHGVTEGGSSGSPIFNNSGLIVGQLSGGSSFCTSPSSPDSYGKISYSWSSCGATPQLQLAPWLDRTGTGATTLTGLDNSCTATSVPVVDFTASNIYPLVTTEVVTITDISTNSPFAWTWVITGPGTATYTEGTTANSQNPHLTFSAAGAYTVVLTAANTGGYGLKTKAAYIHVGNIGIENEDQNPIILYPIPARDMLYVNLGTNIWNLDKTTISIMDLTGKYVLVERMINANANTLSVQIPESIASGFYLVQITDGKNIKTEKLEISK